MKKLKLNGKFDLNKRSISILNGNDQKQVVGGKDKKTDSRMTVMDTLTCHCDSQMTVMDTFTCHCDSKVKKC